MGIPLSQQLRAIGIALFFGILTGALYDFIRVSRVLLRLSSYSDAGRLYAKPLPWIGASAAGRQRGRAARLILLALGDLFFAACAAAMYCVCVSGAAYGEIRWFTLAAFGGGFVIWYATIGRLVMLLSETIAFLLRTIVRYILFFLTRPFVWGGRLLRRIVRWTARRWILPVRQRILLRRRIAYTETVRRAIAAQIRIL